MIIFHGENAALSRGALVSAMQTAKTAGHTIIRLEAKRLTEADLETNLGYQSLFGELKTIVIEELHSLPTSARKKNLLKLLQTTQTPHHLILWEKRSLTPTMLKVFGGAEVKEFKISNSVFNWLDSLSASPQTRTRQLTLLQAALQQEDAFMIFLMLIRQIRLLIQSKSGGQIKGAPFIIAKLKKQAAQFDLEQLVDSHARLLTIDRQQKTSQGRLTLTQELELFSF
jgi:DNA polymerase III delta subunit